MISHSQTAFISERQILDGVLILNEVIHELKSKKKSGFILKADFSKAFDCVSWKYLDNTLSAMGFGSIWHNWISSCLSSSSISVLVNGSPKATFNISKGLQQGDPLSPFLFIIAAEGFNTMMESASSAGLFKGLQIGSGNLILTHLQYADDTVIVGVNSKENIKAAKFILKWYELVSGLRINFKKSKLITINCSTFWSESAAAILNCCTGKLPSSYLGLPIGDSPSKITAPRGRSLSEFQALLNMLSDIMLTPFSKDAIKWSLSSTFSVASVYSQLGQHSRILPKAIVDAIWIKWSPPRTRVFSWKLAHVALPTKWNLLCRGIIATDFDPICLLCGSELEDHNHLFIHCSVTQRLWYSLLKWWNLPFIFPEGVQDLFQQTQSISTAPGINSLFLLTCLCSVWAIWFARNNLLHNGIPWDENSLLHFIQSRTFAWIRGSSPEIIFTPSDWFLFPSQVATLF